MTLPGSIGIGIAWFLLWIFAQAAFHKITAPVYYQQLMQRYVPGLPGGRLLVALVAMVETGIALSLLVSQWRETGLVAAATLLLAYATLMASEILRGRAGMQCGCAGPDSQLGISWALVVRNSICAALAVLALSASTLVEVSWLGVGLSGFVAMFMALVYLTSEQIISNAQWMAGEA
jgi:hypothetical protein